MKKRLLSLHRCTSLKTRIIIHFILISFISIGITYYITFDGLEKEIKDTYFQKLTAIREIKKTQIQSYFEELRSDVIVLSKSPFIINHYDKLSLNYNKNEEHIVEKYDKYFNRYIEKKDFYDVFIVDINSSNIIYTAKKESDFKTNINTGICCDTNLHKIYTKIISSKNNEVSIVDFEHYAPSGNKPASFIGSKILNAENKPVGVLILQIPIVKINEIMTGKYNWKNEGFGKTGECYIISNDCTMRNDSRFFIEDKNKYLSNMKKLGIDNDVIESIKDYDTTVLHQSVKGEVCKYLLDAKNEVQILKDYRGIEVLSAFAPLEIDGLNWVILSEIYKSEAFKFIPKLNQEILLILVVIFILIIISTFIFTKTITEPLYLLTNAVKSIGKGDLSKRVKINCDDEIGELASCFNRSIEQLEQMNHSVEHFTKLSVTDNLTQIYNRLKLHHDLDIEMKRVQRNKSTFSLVMFDIDHFKRINDTYGHDIGDITLVDLVKLVSKNIRQTDIFARWGGEEFMLLLTNTTIDDAKVLTEKIRVKIQDYEFKEIKNMTCSFGVTEYNVKDTKESIIKRVDEALYSAKHNGRNRLETA